MSTDKSKRRSPPNASLGLGQKVTLLVLVVAWLAIVIGSQLVMPRLLGAAYDGESFGWLDQKIANHRAYREGAGFDASRDWYLGWAQGYALKSSALATLGLVVAGVLICSRAARRRVKRFLYSSSSPLNLAILRVAAFGMLFYLLRTEPIMTYAQWPREMYQWPFLAGMLYKSLPITPEVVGPALTIATIAAGMAAIGLLTRFSTLVSVVLGIYLIGIPQLSGKVNHLHHVVMIGMVLACSRCGDALSLDSIWRALRNADKGTVSAPRRAVRYGMPLRICMMILATVYFFPGFWKIASNGPAWIFSNNLENHMLQKWFELEYYEPPIPLHKMPLSGPMGSLYAVVFEFFLPIALLWRPTRAIWAMMGITFHNLTNILMNISFMTLQVMYVMFVDWQKLLAWLGQRLFRSPLQVLYDGNCGLCRRTMSILNQLDWLQSLKPVNALDREAVEAEGLGYLDDAALMKDMHAAWKVEPNSGEGPSSEWKSAKGYDAYQHITWRVPLLWPLIPFIYLPPVAAIGWNVYRRVADSRACTIPSVPQSQEKPSSIWAPSWRWRPLMVVATIILGTQCLLGAGRMHKSWPLACYPLFDQIAERTVVWPEFYAIDSEGKETYLDDDTIRDKLGEARYVESMRRFILTPLDEQAARTMLGSFSKAWLEDDSLPESAESIRISLATYELTGPQRPKEPIEEEPLMQVDLKEIKAIDPE